MFPYPDIARWLSFKPDPIFVEDWLANREIFGSPTSPNDQDRELEEAFLIESLRQEKMSGTKDLPLGVSLSGLGLSGRQKLGTVFLIAPSGPAPIKEKAAAVLEVVTAGQKEKTVIAPIDIVVLPLDKNQTYSVKVSLKGQLRLEGKSNAKMEIVDCAFLVVDTRGRPIAFWEPGVQRGKNKVWRDLLSKTINQ